jgi:RNA polymerase sigma factor for flagellar operon FliA
VVAYFNLAVDQGPNPSRSNQYPQSTHNGMRRQQHRQGCGGTTVKPAHQHIDIERATYEEKLVRDNMPLVHYVVSEVAHRVPGHVNRSDLVSAAMLGLAQAARSYDPERGVAFDRFASTRMRGALLDELRGRDWASRSVRARARGLKSAQDDLTNRLGRTPTPAEIAAELDLPQDDVKKLVDDVHRATVLHYDSLVLEGDAESFLANSDDSPEDVILDRERKGYLAAAVQALPDRLRHVVVGYFFEERSMQDLADELGVSESRVSQLRAEAMVLLRDGINAQLDPDLVSPEARPNGRVARRKASYYATVAAMSDHSTRVSERPVEPTPVVSQRAVAGA